MGPILQSKMGYPHFASAFAIQATTDTPLDFGFGSDLQAWLAAKNPVLTPFSNCNVITYLSRKGRYDFPSYRSRIAHLFRRAGQEKFDRHRAKLKAVFHF